MIHLKTFSMEFTNAGHHPGMLLRDDALYPLDSEGAFLGIFKTPEFQSGTLGLKVGDRPVLYTDGMIEARNYLGDEYGHDRAILCVEIEKIMDGKLAPNGKIAL